MFVAGMFAGFYHVLLKVRLFFGILDVCWIFERSAIYLLLVGGSLPAHFDGCAKKIALYTSQMSCQTAKDIMVKRNHPGVWCVSLSAIGFYAFKIHL